MKSESRQLSFSIQNSPSEVQKTLVFSLVTKLESLSNDIFVFNEDEDFDELNFLANLDDYDYNEPFKSFLEKSLVLYAAFCLSDSRCEKILLKKMLNKEGIIKKTLEDLLERAHVKISEPLCPIELKSMYFLIPTLYKIGSKKNFLRLKNCWDFFLSMYAGFTSWRFSAEYREETFTYSFIFAVSSFLDNWVSYKNKKIIDSKFQTFYLMISAFLFFSFISLGIASFFSEKNWVETAAYGSLGVFAAFVVLGRKYMNSSVDITFFSELVAQKKLMKNLLGNHLSDWPNMKIFFTNSDLFEKFLEIDKKQRKEISSKQIKLNEFRLLLRNYIDAYDNCDEIFKNYELSIIKLNQKIENNQSHEAYIFNREESFRKLGELIENIRIKSEKNDQMKVLKDELAHEMKEFNFSKKITEMQEQIESLSKSSELLENSLEFTKDSFNDLANQRAQIFLTEGVDIQQTDESENLFLSPSLQNYTANPEQKFEGVNNLDLVIKKLNSALQNCETFIEELDSQIISEQENEVDIAIEAIDSIKEEINKKIEEIKSSIPEAVMNKNTFFSQPSSSHIQEMDEDQIEEGTLMGDVNNPSSFVGL